LSARATSISSTTPMIRCCWRRGRLEADSKICRPESFLFEVTAEEMEAMRSQNVTASPKRNVRFLPHAFTEHGALMAANVLNSPQAIKMSVALIETFIRLRQALATTQVLARRLAEIERTVVQHDSALKELFRAIKPLLLPPPEPPRKKIGF
jgi:hypothetical protein